jgi:hypothetical protein
MPSKKSSKKASAKKAGKKSSTSTKWLLKPPGVGEISFSFAAHKSVKLTSETRSALEALAKSLQENQAKALGITAAAARCGPDINCGTRVIDCNVRGICRPESQNPCAINYTCLIFPQIELSES